MRRHPRVVGRAAWPGSRGRRRRTPSPDATPAQLRPSGERAPSATISCRQATSVPSASVSDTTRLDESWCTRNGFRPQQHRAPRSPRRLCGSGRRARCGAPRCRVDGNDGPGQATSTSPPNPVIRRPRCRMCPSSQSPSPSRCSSATARGVSPSPQALSRGNWRSR